MRRLSLVLTVLLALSMAALGGAAINKRVGSSVSLQLGPDVGLFRGTVSSNAEACIRHRKVRIIRAESGETVGSDRANAKGRYRLQSNEQSGQWYAKVRPKQIGGVFCKGDRSTVRSAG